MRSGISFPAAVARDRSCSRAPRKADAVRCPVLKLREVLLERSQLLPIPARGSDRLIKLRADLARLRLRGRDSTRALSGAHEIEAGLGVLACRPCGSLRPPAPSHAPGCAFRMRARRRSNSCGSPSTRPMSALSGSARPPLGTCGMNSAGRGRRPRRAAPALRVRLLERDHARGLLKRPQRPPRHAARAAAANPRRSPRPHAPSSAPRGASTGSSS